MDLKVTYYMDFETTYNGCYEKVILCIDSLLN
jgi:hypothetical protein